MDSSCAHVECGLAPYREATRRRCLSAFRWRGGPGITAKPGREEDEEELHPRLGYRIFGFWCVTFAECFQ
ncbi:MAG: hypothetical protein DMG50_15355 [Acidobacteria bacterium]|nr:MAG: hypothetical protein DMG50_15355 [Acidobacteriota bacterium]